MIRQKKIDESIDAWKNALRLNPADNDARENLVRALMEKKKQEQQQQQNKKDNPDKNKIRRQTKKGSENSRIITPNPSKAN